MKVSPDVARIRAEQADGYSFTGHRTVAETDAMEDFKPGGTD